MIKKDIFKILGGFDEKFFLSAQDSLDLCKRVRLLGFKTIFLPMIIVTHFCGRSSKGNITVEKNVVYLMYMHFGHLYYFKKYYGRKMVYVLKPIFFLISFTKYLLFKLQYILSGKETAKIKSITRMEVCKKIIEIDI